MAAELQQWCLAVVGMREVPPQEVLEALTGPPRAAELWRFLVARVRTPKQAQLIRNNLIVSSGLSPKDKKSDPEEKKMSALIGKLERELEKFEMRAHALEEELKGLRSDLLERARVKNQEEKKEMDERLRVAARKFHEMRIASVTKEVNTARAAVAGLGEFCGMSGRRHANTSNSKTRVYVIEKKGGQRLQSRAEARIENAVEDLLVAARKTCSLSALTPILNEIVRSDSLDEIFSAAKHSAELDRSTLRANEMRGGDDFREGCHERAELIKSMQKVHVSSFVKLEKLITEMLHQEELARKELLGDSGSDSDQKNYPALICGEKAILALVEKERKSLQCQVNDPSLVAKMEVVKLRDSEVNTLEERILLRRSLAKKVMMQNRIAYDALSHLSAEMSGYLRSRLLSSTSQAKEALSTRFHFEQQAAAYLASVNVEEIQKISYKSQRVPIEALRVAHGADPLGMASQFDNSSDHMTEDCWRSCMMASSSRFRAAAGAKKLQESKRAVGKLKEMCSRITVAATKAKSSFLDSCREPLKIENENMRRCLEADFPSLKEDMRIWWTQPAREAASWKRVDDKTLSEWESYFSEHFVAKGSSE